MSKTMSKPIAIIKELYTSQLVFFDLMFDLNESYKNVGEKWGKNSTDSGFTHLYLLHLFQGLKCLTLPIIETYTLACHIFKISPFNQISNQISLIFLLFLISYIIIIIRANR